MQQEMIVSLSDNIQTVVRRIAVVAAVVLTAGIGSPAAAQSGGSAGDAAEPAAGQAPGTSESGGQAASFSTGAEGRANKADNKNKGPQPGDPHYWAKTRKIHTVQKREFQKLNRLGVTAYTGLIPNNIFERYFPVGIRLNYFMLENIGLELSGSRALRAETELEGVLNESSGVNAETVRVADTQLYHANFGVLWSPFYGKTSFNETSIGYFDMFLFGGMGMVVTKTPQESGQDLSEVTSTIKPEGVLGAGISFFFLDNAMIRADYRQFIFQKVPGVGGVANPSEISLGFGYFF